MYECYFLHLQHLHHASGTEVFRMSSFSLDYQNKAPGQMSVATVCVLSDTRSLITSAADKGANQKQTVLCVSVGI